MDYPKLPPLPLFLHTWTRYAGIFEVSKSTTGITPASSTWPVANTAFYIPIWLPWPYPVKRVFWVNGSSVASTNMDLGIYTAAGTRIYSTGSTAASGASATQYVTPSPDFILAPGRYYFALSDSSTTANRGGQASTAPTVARIRLAGLLQEASALPLPANMTPAAVANAYLPLFGVTRLASGF